MLELLLSRYFYTMNASDIIIKFFIITINQVNFWLLIGMKDQGMEGSFGVW